MPNLSAIAVAMNAAREANTAELVVEHIYKVGNTYAQYPRKRGQKRPNFHAIAEAMNAAAKYQEAQKERFVDIYLTEKKTGWQKVQIPIAPESIDYKSGEAAVATFDIINSGPVDVPLGVGLKELSWEGTLPGAAGPYETLMRCEWKPPSYYDGLFRTWKESGQMLSVVVTGYPINFDCYLKDYTAKLSGPYRDIDYTLHLVQKKQVGIVKPNLHAVAEGMNAMLNQKKEAESAAEKKRPTDEEKTYTIKSGDSMWSIAQQKLGDGSRWKELYEYNKEALDEEAKKYGVTSNNGSYIYPGVTIKIP